MKQKTRRDLIVFVNAANQFLKEKGDKSLISLHLDEWLEENKDQVQSHTKEQNKITKTVLSRPSNKIAITHASVDDKNNVLVDKDGRYSYTNSKASLMQDEIAKIEDDYYEKITAFHGELVEIIPNYLEKEKLPKKIERVYLESFFDFIIKREDWYSVETSVVDYK